MKNIFIALALSLLSLNVWAKELSPVGYWKTIDDVTGQPKSIVQIYEAPNHALKGKVVRLFKDPERLCTACEGEQHNKPIVGLQVMNQLKRSAENKNEWIGGDILDPKSGKMYHCSIKISEKGQQLNVRGYIGLPLFGRTQTWVRVENETNVRNSG